MEYGKRKKVRQAKVLFTEGARYHSVSSLAKLVELIAEKPKAKDVKLLERLLPTFKEEELPENLRALSMALAS